MEIGLVTSLESLQIRSDWPSLDCRRRLLAPMHCSLLTLIRGRRLADCSSPRHCLSLQVSLLSCSGAPFLKVFHFTKLTWNLSLFFSLTLSQSLTHSLSLSIWIEMNETLSICDWPNFSFINFFVYFWLFEFGFISLSYPLVLVCVVCWCWCLWDINCLLV